LADDRLRIRVGKFDANEDFAAVELGGLFIHSSPGFSPTIVAFPSYPDPAMGLSLFYEASDQAYIGFGLFDGSTQEGIRTGARGPSRAFRAPGDLFLASEGGVNWQRGPDALPGRLAVGLWHHTGTFPQFAGGRESGTEGTYLVLEQLLHAADDSAQDLEARGLGAFLQVGLADESVSPISRHLAAGLLLRGPTDGRPDDALGLMISHVRLSQEMGSGLTGDDETAWELFYRFQVNSRVVVQPDLQYIRNPGGAGLDDSLVATVRVEISL
ncbi:MAG: carbohydrate porin, partial [Phycisphaerae bacterium]|nr:carbohydrate porin [Phycisphaerae bacterium]